MGVQWPEGFIGQEYSMNIILGLPVVFTGQENSATTSIQWPGVFHFPGLFSGQKYPVVKRI